MLKRHADVLDGQLEKLVYDPVVKLSLAELRHFYGVERFARNSWRDLSERLPEGVEIGSVEIYENGDELYLRKVAGWVDLSDKI